MAKLSLYELNNYISNSISNLQNQINNKQTTIVYDANTRWFTDSERNKLLGIQTNAEVNQNAYSYVRVGSTTLAAAYKMATLELVSGSNISLVPSVSANQIVINNTYAHPDKHPATIITQDSTHRFVTDEQIANWNNKSSTTLATNYSDGLMSASDKIKLDNILKILKGSSSFVGLNDYQQIELGINMNDTSYVVQITPTASPDGSLGEVWVEKSTTNIRVYNSGGFTGGFDWVLFY